MTKLDEAVTLLRAERDRIDAALAALEVETNTHQTVKPVVKVVSAPAKKSPAKKAVKRHISVEGRARIAAATKARWARVKAAKEAKAAAKKTPAKKATK